MIALRLRIGGDLNFETFEGFLTIQWITCTVSCAEQARKIALHHGLLALRAV